MASGLIHEDINHNKYSRQNQTLALAVIPFPEPLERRRNSTIKGNSGHSTDYHERSEGRIGSLRRETEGEMESGL